MLDLDRPFYPISLRTGDERRETVLVFRDHQDPNLFYALPPAPRLAMRDGAPAFRLLKYRFPIEAIAEGQSPGGGMAFIEVEVGLTSSQLEFLRTEVARLAERPDARVVPTLFRRGTARSLIASEGEQGRLVQDLAATRPVSAAPPHVAAFALDLTPAGATLLERATADGGAPVGVVYDFEFEGLLPALDATVRIDYDRCYERFAAALALEIYYVRVELGTDLQWLRENDAIDIQLDHLVDDADRDQREQRVMALVQARIEQDFFRSAMPAKPLGASGPLSGLLSGLLGPDEPEASSAMFVLKARYELEVELKTFEMDFHNRQAQTFSHVSAGHLGWMVGGRAVQVRELDLGSDFFRRLDLQVVRAFEPRLTPGFLRAVVDIEHGDIERGLSKHSFVIDDSEERRVQHLSVPLAEGADRTYRWRARFEYEPGFGLGPSSFEVGPIESQSSVLAVSPEVALAASRLEIRTVPWAPEIASYKVELTVAHPETEETLAEESLILTPGNSEFTLWYRRAVSDAEPKVRIAVTTVLQDGTQHRAPDTWLHRATGAVFVRPSFDHRIRLVLAPAIDWGATARALVAVRYSDATGLREFTQVFTPSNGAERVLEFLSPEKLHAWEYRVLVTHLDGTIDEADWVSTEESVVVISPGSGAPAMVQVVVVGDWGDALGVIVRLSPAGDPSDARVLFFQPGDSTKQFVPLPKVDGALRYHFEISRVTNAGEAPVRQGDSDTQILVVTPAAT